MTLEEAEPTHNTDPAGDLEDDEDDEEAADMEAFEVSGMLDEQDKVSFLLNSYVLSMCIKAFVLFRGYDCEYFSFVVYNGCIEKTDQRESGNIF